MMQGLFKELCMYLLIESLQHTREVYVSLGYHFIDWDPSGPQDHTARKGASNPGSCLRAHTLVHVSLLPFQGERHSMQTRTGRKRW